MKVCPNCGAECVDEAVMCVSCGTKFEKIKTKKQQSVSKQQPKKENPIFLDVAEILIVMASLIYLILSFGISVLLLKLCSFVSFLVIAICCFLTNKTNLNKVTGVVIELVFFCGSLLPLLDFIIKWL